MSIGPEAVASLSFSPKDKVNHVVLAQEAQASRAKMISFGSEISRWALFLGEGKTAEKLGEAVFRTPMPDYYRRSDTKRAKVEEVNVSSHRNHLGMLVAVDTLIGAYHTLEEIHVNPFIEAALSTVPSIAPHIEGWRYEVDTGSTVPTFALVRNLPSLRPERHATGIIN